ncbi:nucleotidyltransferase family protein [Ancylobacter sp.]|uniref:nucleotidyltransferase family protein n=1 Tax=Ancylobacter sp. TaxID=1872567 RepID=UPI003D096CB9
MSLQAFPLQELLPYLQPDAIDKAVLAVCLASPDDVADDWARLIHAVGSLPALMRQRPFLRRLLPLIGHRLASANIEPDRETADLLSASQVWEAARTARILQLLARLETGLSSMAGALVMPKGPLLAERIYPSVSLRHCHDIDLLIRSDNLAEIETVLSDQGFSSAQNSRDEARPYFPRIWTHRDGLPIILHVNPWDGDPLTDLGFFERASRQRANKSRLVPPSDVDLFAYLCMHRGLYRDPGRVGWLVDCGLLLASDPPAGSFWPALLDRACETRLTARLCLRLHVLNASGVRIPNSVLARIAVLAWSGWRQERMSTLACMADETRLGSRGLWRATGWRTGVYVVLSALRARLPETTQRIAV